MQQGRCQQPECGSPCSSHARTVLSTAAVRPDAINNEQTAHRMLQGDLSYSYRDALPVHLKRQQTG